MGKLSFPVKRYRTVFSIVFFGFELRFDGWPSHDHGRKAKGISREDMIVKVLNNSFSYCLPLDFVMRGKKGLLVYATLSWLLLLKVKQITK